MRVPGMSSDPTERLRTEKAEQIAPVPRISIQAFCDSPDVSQVVTAAASDRRMDRAQIKVHMGGASAAVEAYRAAPTPNVIIIESGAGRDELLSFLESLSDFCDAGTKVVVIGRLNDIVLYRDLMGPGRERLPGGPVQRHRSRPRPLAPLLEHGGGAGRPHRRGHGDQGGLRRVDGRPQPRLGDLARDAAPHRNCGPGSAVRNRGPRFQPGPAAKHRGSRLRPGPSRQQPHRSAPVEVHGQPQPAGRAGDARAPLRFLGNRLRRRL